MRLRSLLPPSAFLLALGCTTVTVIETIEPTPTLAIVNARVWTGDPKRPWADAVLVTGDRITTVGSSAEVRKAVRPPTRVIDANGAMLAPGKSLDEALANYTHAVSTAPTATANGIIARDKPADLVLIDRDLTRLPREQLSEAKVLISVLGGRVVYEQRAAP